MHVNRRPNSDLPLRVILCPQSGHDVTVFCRSFLVTILSSSHHHRREILFVNKLPIVFSPALGAKGVAEMGLRAVADVPHPIVKAMGSSDRFHAITFEYNAHPPEGGYSLSAH
jgi:hypothetical protein